PDRPAAGLGSREQLATTYERHAGLAIDRDALRWWELFGTLRWGVICVIQAFTHLSGAARSLEHAVIGRRACEVEWDVIDLLASLAVGDDAELAERIRAGAFDGRRSELMAALRSIVRAKLEAANPRHLEFAESGEERRP